MAKPSAATHPTIADPPVEDYLTLERCGLVTFYEKNRHVLNALVVCLYRLLIENSAKYEAMGMMMGKEQLPLQLRDLLLGTLSTHHKVGEEIGLIARAYWNHCYDYLPKVKGPRLLLSDYSYKDSENLKTHSDFCSYVIREAFRDNFDYKVRNPGEYEKCEKLVKEANEKTGTMRDVRLGETKG